MSPKDRDAPYTHLEVTIQDSGLFTAVEPRWLATVNNRQTWVNRSRGVVLITVPSGGLSAHTFSDSSLGETYNSHGHYDADDLVRWWFPVMKSDKAWAHHVAFDGEHGYDITIAAERVS